MKSMVNEKDIKKIFNDACSIFEINSGECSEALEAIYSSKQFHDMKQNTKQALMELTIDSKTQAMLFVMIAYDLKSPYCFYTNLERGIELGIGKEELHMVKHIATALENMGKEDLLLGLAIELISNGSSEPRTAALLIYAKVLALIGEKDRVGKYREFAESRGVTSQEIEDLERILQIVKDWCNVLPSQITEDDITETISF